MDGVWGVFVSCYGDGAVDDSGGDPGGRGGRVQAEAESRDTQGPLTSENLALGTSPGT